jgi:hypothetical protein|eukprot:1192910-Prymnesium_polylepis.2
MSGRGKGGKCIGYKKQRVPEFEWTSGQNAFNVAYINNDDCEVYIFIVPENKLHPVLAHVFKESGRKTFAWDIGQDELPDDMFERLTQKKFDKLTSEEGDDGDDEGEGEEDDEDDEQIVDEDVVVDHIRHWITNLSDKFLDPAGVSVNILANFGIHDRV